MGRRASTIAALSVVLVAALGVDRLRTTLAARLHRVKEIDDVYPLPPPAYVKRLAIGYDDAAVSILWASLLYQYGQHVNEQRRFTYSTQYLRTIVHLDPRFSPAYEYGATFLTMQTVEPDHAEIEALRTVLYDGTNELPSSANVWGAYATFLLFESSPYLTVAEREAWRKVGAVAAERAAELGYANDEFGETGAIYLERQGELRLALQQLERAYPVAPTEEVRTRIEKRMEKIRKALGQAEQDEVVRAQRRFLRTWTAQAGFVGESLFDLVAPERDVAACAGRVDEPRCAIGWTGWSASTEAASHAPSP